MSKEFDPVAAVVKLIFGLLGLIVAAQLITELFARLRVVISDLLLLTLLFIGSRAAFGMLQSERKERERPARRGTERTPLVPPPGDEE